MKLKTMASSRWYGLARVSSLLLAIIAILMYLQGAASFIENLQMGFTGAWCRNCSLDTTARELIIVTNSPADIAGIESGDLIVAVDGTLVDELGPFKEHGDEILYSGEAGTKVNLTVKKADNFIYEYTIIRETGWNSFTTIGPRILGSSSKLATSIALFVEALIFFGFSGTGIFLLRQQKNKLMLISGLALILLIMSTTKSALLLERNSLSVFLISASLIAFYLVFFYFPDGKIFPRWGLIPVGLYLLWLIFNAFFLRPLFGSFDVSRLIDIIFWSLALTIQTVRYRNISTPEQRQQIKWILAGFFLTIIERSVFLGIGFLSPDFSVTENPSAFSHLYWSIGDTVSRLLYLIIPASFLISIMRFRLWDIDYVINRSIVYGAITLSLGLIFAFVTYITQSLLANIFGDATLGAISATTSFIAVLGVFPKLQEYMRKMVDSKLYGINIDYPIKKINFSRRIPSDLKIEKSSFEEFTNITLIGQGGMGEVYSASRLGMDEPVAIKILPGNLAKDKASKIRLFREAEIASKLKHKNIVRLIEYGEADGFPFIVMELIKGKNLQTILAERENIPLSTICSIFNDLGKALDYAHKSGVVHRDIKPSNIMIECEDLNNPFSAEYRCVLTDFGIAKLVSDSKHASTTGIKGTFTYLAPEQISEAKEIDNRIDIYAGGVLAYRLLTGQLPFTDSNLAKLLLSHLYKPPVPPSQILDNISNNVEKAILRALEKDPVERFPSMGEFSQALCI